MTPRERAQQVVDMWPIGRDGWVECIERAIRSAVRQAEREAIERCARVADEYAEVNREMAGDTILMDPALHGDKPLAELTDADWCRSREMRIQGCIHSSMFHAAQNVAESIRNLSPDSSPDKEQT